MSISLWIMIGLGACIALGGIGWIIKVYFKATDGTKVDFKVVALSGDILTIGREFPNTTKDIRSRDIAKVLIWMNHGKLASSAQIDSPNTDMYKEYTLALSPEELIVFCKRNNITCIGEEQETGTRVELNKGTNPQHDLNFFNEQLPTQREG